MIRKTQWSGWKKDFPERRAALIVLNIEPAYDFLRDEQRFQEMVKN